MARCQSWFISWCSIVYGYQNVSLESTTLVHGKACSSDMSGTGPLDIAENGLFDLTFVIMSGWCFGTCFKIFRILGISSSQLTFTPSFFRWVGLNHQHYNKVIIQRRTLSFTKLWGSGQPQRFSWLASHNHAGRAFLLASLRRFWWIWQARWMCFLQGCGTHELDWFWETDLISHICTYTYICICIYIDVCMYMYI